MNSVQRVEQTWIKENTNLFHLCHIAKNLYNEANYIIRQEFITNKLWLRYNKLYSQLKQSDNYKNLPAQTSKQILKLLDKNWNSFFKASKD